MHVVFLIEKPNIIPQSNRLQVDRLMQKVYISTNRLQNASSRLSPSTRIMKRSAGRLTFGYRNSQYLHVLSRTRSALATSRPSIHSSHRFLVDCMDSQFPEVESFQQSQVAAVCIRIMYSVDMQNVQVGCKILHVDHWDRLVEFF